MSTPDNQNEEKVETGSQLAYTTTTGDESKSKLARNAADKEAPVHKAVTEKRIAKKTVKKPAFSRVSAPSTTLTHIKVDERVLAKAKDIVASNDNLYSRYDIVDNETVIVR
jgi:hypothetical protein